MNRRRLIEAFDLPRKTADAASQTTTRSKFGPGELSTWDCFVRRKEDCWVQDNISKKSTVNKEKVILSNAFFNFALADATDRALIGALIEQYDVYIWSGHHTDFNYPVTSREEFWRLCANTQAATEEEIRNNLADQSINPNEFHIIDLHRYLLTRSRWHGDTHFKRHTLLLADYPVNEKKFLDQLPKAVDANKIGTLSVQSTTRDTLNVLMRDFPQSHLDVVAPVLEARHLKQRFEKRAVLHTESPGKQSNRVVILGSAPPEIASYQSVSCKSNAEVNQQLTELPEPVRGIEIRLDRVGEIKLSAAPAHLKTLTLSSRSLIKTIDVGEQPHLEQLTIQFPAEAKRTWMFYSSINLSLCRHIKKLRLEKLKSMDVKSAPAVIELPKDSNITELEVVESVGIKLDLKKFPRLEVLKLIDWNRLRCAPSVITDLPHLKELYIGGGVYPAVNYPQLPKLTTLTLAQIDTPASPLFNFAQWANIDK